MTATTVNTAIKELRDFVKDGVQTTCLQGYAAEKLP